MLSACQLFVVEVLQGRVRYQPSEDYIGFEPYLRIFYVTKHICKREYSTHLYRRSASCGTIGYVYPTFRPKLRSGAGSWGNIPSGPAEGRCPNCHAHIRDCQTSIFWQKERPGGPNDLCVLPGHRTVLQQSNPQVRARLPPSLPLGLGNRFACKSSGVPYGIWEPYFEEPVFMP